MIKVWNNSDMSAVRRRTCAAPGKGRRGPRVLHLPNIAVPGSPLQPSLPSADGPSQGSRGKGNISRKLACCGTVRISNRPSHKVPLPAWSCTTSVHDSLLFTCVIQDKFASCRKTLGYTSRLYQWQRRRSRLQLRQRNPRTTRFVKERSVPAPPQP